uniref:Neuropeptide-Like Protein n=2 Tax=Loa loa TaxID=7209 RepID=A0A1I7V5J4_LOALO
MMLTMKIFRHCVIVYLLTYAYGISDDEKEHSSILTSPEAEDLERQLFLNAKRAGARAFSPMKGNNFENHFFPNMKRHQTFSPYYYYQQPKRGGGHPFYTFWGPSNAGDIKYDESMPFYKRHSSLRDSADYIY